MQVLNNQIISFNDASNEDIRWTWACRVLDNNRYKVNTSRTTPKVGNLALVRVGQVGRHNSIMTTNNKKLRIYENDLIVGVFGNRYATNAFEGEVDNVVDLCILTAGGMIGTLKSRHC